jgi:hypothetical protein
LKSHALKSRGHTAAVKLARCDPIGMTLWLTLPSYAA